MAKTRSMTATAEQDVYRTSVQLLVTYEKAAEIIGGDKPVSVRHVERLVAAGKLRSIGSGQARRIVYNSIISYIETGGRL